MARALPTLALTLPLLLASLSHASAETKSWSEKHADRVSRVRREHKLVIQVIVPLCSNQQIDCGATWAGNPEGLRTNLYWGAIFGARTFLEGPKRGWERVDLAEGELPTLEQAVFRRSVAGARWGIDAPVELLVVLQAVHGSFINDAVDRFFSVATQGGEVRFQDGGNERREPVSVVGYAGHNRLMDGKKLPPKPSSPSPIPSFVLACMSESYFGSALRDAGSDTLVTTRAYMAPEGYVVDAVTRAIGENRSVEEIRDAAVEATSFWQRIPRWQAEQVFAR